MAYQRREEDERHGARNAPTAKAYSAKSELEKLYDQAGQTTFYFPDRLLLRHTLIVGSTGSGKTNHSFHLIREVCQRSDSVRFFIIDVKKDYRRLARILPPGQLQTLAIGEEPRASFNPLVPPSGVPTQQWDRAFADIFVRAYGLSEPSRRILLDSLKSLRDASKVQPTLRELEAAVRRFKAESSREQGSQRSLDSRLHNINGGDVGSALNTEAVLDPGALARVAVFEMGNVDSLLDQRFLVEFVLMHLWLADKKRVFAGEERLSRVMVIEEAHRFLSEDRPPERRGDRALLELAMAEARSYGWGFVIVDQMPTLLSRYVWDNVGTVLAHRLANVDSYERVKKAVSGAVPLMAEDLNDPVALRLPEDLALFRRYVTSPDEKGIGVVWVDRVRET